ncbi:hypothetical protein CHELA40_13849 [Chelatococcus asaccharovorans]|nr:hypothetical protein CHELA40_13849 [Chelatococcus asaccharovorans]
MMVRYIARPDGSALYDASRVMQAVAAGRMTDVRGCQGLADRYFELPGAGWEFGVLGCQVPGFF